MKTITINVPDSIDLSSLDLTMMIASKLYEQGKLSLGQASELTNLSKRAFTELLGKYNVSVLNYPASDIAKDVNCA